ncbi:fumarate hydratase [Actinomadura sp. KC216]|uniref:fumarate hydratase n=1 Tax=Actinomadura sp. KC216 TaxID=2530370 RepID=UPI001404F96E|nr:fumarate hydratase [Actinomadura sp. KC216]
MRLSADLVEDLAYQLYGQALKRYPPDIKATLRQAQGTEKDPTAQEVLTVALKSIDRAEQLDKPVCQDTGMQTVWCRVGRGVTFDGPGIEEAVRSGVGRWTREHEYRRTIVQPLNRNKYPEQSAAGHPKVEWEWFDGEECVEMMLLSKGSGSENQGFHKMLVPADGLAGAKRFIVDSVIQAGGQFCPPGIAGIGFGSTFDGVARLAKRALLRDCRTGHPEPEIAALEEELLAEINDTGIGPMGLGGTTTLLGLNIEYEATHETQNPVALNLQCWAHRKAGVRIRPGGHEFIWEFGGDGVEA